MTNIFKRRREGFTLIELILSMGLLALVIIMSGSIMMLGKTILDKTESEYEFQFSTRMTFYKTSDIIRYSSAVFTIPKSSFRPDNLDSGWDYIGVHEVVITPAEGGNAAVTGSEIVKYAYDQATDTHIPTVLLTADPNIRYEFIFTKINPHNVDSLLQFAIKTYTAGSIDEFGRPKATLTVTSEVTSQNSLQVIDLGTAADPAVAIAFSSQTRSKNVVGHIAMVLDTSGSMADDLSGNPIGGHSGNASRISILKSRATTLINEFAMEDNTDISLVPFATSANNPYPFYSSSATTQSLLNIVSGLHAVGGTNTGDGLRRAYHGLVSCNAEVGADVTSSNYVIVLVDGVTTFASVISDHNRDFVTGGGNVNEGFLDRWGEYNSYGQIAGNGTTLDAVGTGYVDAMGALLSGGSFSKVYVIGFSSLPSEFESVNDIAAACNAPSDRVFRATSEDALTQVFQEIRQDIVNDLWYLQGPDL